MSGKQINSLYREPIYILVRNKGLFPRLFLKNAQVVLFPAPGTPANSIIDISDITHMVHSLHIITSKGINSFCLKFIPLSTSIVF